MTKQKLILLLFILGGIVYFLYGQFFSHNNGMQGGAAPVDVAEVIERDIQLWSDFTGRLAAVNQADIRPRVTGTIDSIHFENGATVKKGDLLFVIDPRPFEAALLAAEARAEYAEAEYKRGQTLIEAKAISQSAFDLRKNNYKSAKADLINAQVNLEYANIKSPIDGKISRAELTVGNLVDGGPGAPLLANVTSNKTIYADFEIDENTYLQFASDSAKKDSTQMQVQLGLANDTNTPFLGHINSFDNRLNPGTGTLRARAVFENPELRLVPGLFARVRVGSLEKHKSILITDKAVGTDQSKRFVMVVGPENKVEYRVIKMGPLVDGLRIVEEGLKPGEVVIVSGLQRARPGQPVTPNRVAMDQKEEPNNAKKG